MKKMEPVNPDKKIAKNVTREDHFEFINNIKGGVIPQEFISPVEKGIREAMARGFLERLGRRAWPRFSGAYLLHARKRVHSMTPVRLRQRMRTAVIGGLAEPAARRVS
jgi:hypothetical protein